MSWAKISHKIRTHKKLGLMALFVFLVVSAVSSFALFEDKKTPSILVQDAGLTCQVKLQKPWQNFVSILGFSSIVYQESKQDENSRVMLGFVITKFKGESFEASDVEKEFESFRQAKAEYVKEEGGTFLGAAESLKGENGIYRISVKYRQDGEDIRDSSYFFFVNKQLFHAKALFNFKKFDEAVVERQVFDLLAGIRCSND